MSWIRLSHNNELDQIEIILKIWGCSNYFKLNIFIIILINSLLKWIKKIINNINDKSSIDRQLSYKVFI